MTTFSRCHLMVVGFVFAVLAVTFGIPQPVFAAGLWYVANSGNDGADCLSPGTACATINGALNKTDFVSGDAIRIATGTYHGIGIEGVQIEKNVSLFGGWDLSFTTQNGTSTIDGEGARRGITVLGNVTVVIERFTIQNGFDIIDVFSGAGGGGGIRNESGNLTVSNSTVTHNVSSYPEGAAIGGGILNGPEGVLTVINSSITSNTGDFGGGGIASSGTATITDSTIDGNTAGKDGYSGGGGGGGIQHFPPNSLMINNSTISNNKLLGYFSGSGIEAFGTVTLNNSTVSGNSGGAFGEGIYGFVATVNLNNSTITNNQHYGIFNQASTFTLKHSLIANNGSSDCYNDPIYSGAINSFGNNLIENNVNCTLSNNDLIYMDPILGPLQNNGGLTFTHALLEGSPAIDIDSSDCPPPATDQRGVSRPQGIACDIGSYEVGVLDPLVPFAALDANVTLSMRAQGKDYFFTRGTLTLGNASNSINPIAEQVVLSLADTDGKFFEQTLLPGSFESFGRGGFLLRAPNGSSGIRLMIIKPTKKAGTFAFQVRGVKLNLSEADNPPITLSLQIGDDAGSDVMICKNQSGAFICRCNKNL